MSGNSVVDERALREIYLKEFEIAVKEGHPSTVMCSYNRVDGMFSSVNRWLLTDVLRDEWGFDGLVMSDWGAMSERVDAIRAGLDLEMPGPAGENADKVRAAVEDGTLSMADLDMCVKRIVSLILKASDVVKRPVRPAGEQWYPATEKGCKLCSHRLSGRQDTLPGGRFQQNQSDQAGHDKGFIPDVRLRHWIRSRNRKHHGRADRRGHQYKQRQGCVHRRHRASRLIRGGRIRQKGHGPAPGAGETG